jgi:hypothetical protein
VRAGSVDAPAARLCLSGVRTMALATRLARRFPPTMLAKHVGAVDPQAQWLFTSARWSLGVTVLEVRSQEQVASQPAAVRPIPAAARTSAGVSRLCAARRRGGPVAQPELGRLLDVRVKSQARTALIGILVLIALARSKARSVPGFARSATGHQRNHDCRWAGPCTDMRHRVARKIQPACDGDQDLPCDGDSLWTASVMELSSKYLPTARHPSKIIQKSVFSALECEIRNRHPSAPRAP